METDHALVQFVIVMQLPLTDQIANAKNRFDLRVAVASAFEDWMAQHDCYDLAPQVKTVNLIEGYDMTRPDVPRSPVV